MNTNREKGLMPAAKVMRLQQKIAAPTNFVEEDAGEAINPWGLVRRYALLAVILIGLGALAGVAMVVFETPIYKSRILIEVQPTSQSVMQNGMDPFAAMFTMDAVNVQTQVKLLEAGPFRQQVYSDMVKMPTPAVPAPTDLFGKLRALLRPSAHRQALSTQNALDMAAHTFTVSTVNETRLIELGCESPNPVITAAYLNNVAAAFIEGAKRERADAADATHDWLTHHLEETKSKLQASDAHLRSFVLQSGNVFASSEATVDDVKLRDLQTQLSAAQIDELAKQSAYESAVRKGDYESLPAIVNDPIAAGLRSQIAELDRQKGALLLNLTEKNPKIIALEDQRRYLEAALQREAQHIIGRLHEEYQASLNRENLLLKAYAEESGRVSAQASKASQYSDLRRETDDLQKQYDSLLTELSKTQVAQSAPIFPLRLVQPSQAPLLPSQPQPATLLILGILAGVAATLVTAFIREKADRGIGSPETLRMLVRVPQLGVIPAADELSKFPGSGTHSGLKEAPKVQLLATASESSAAGVDSAAVARAAWEEGSDLLADSFRATVTSINRFFGSSADTPAILVTSATAGAGKTTVLSNLGIALSESGRRVVLVDGDFRRPRLSRIFGTGLGVALPDVLASNKPVHEYSLDQLTVPTKFPRLSLLPSYTPEEGVATLVYSRRFPEILERLRHAFDVVLIDAPPALFPADARVLAEFCHAAILVVRAGHCERDTVRAAARCLHQDNVPILGTVLNDWVPMGPKSGMQYYSDYLEPKKAG